MRKVVLAAVIVASALLGMVVPSVAAAEVPGSDAKVVIIVGADTPQYLDDANELYAEAIKHTRTSSGFTAPTRRGRPSRPRRPARTS